MSVKFHGVLLFSKQTSKSSSTPLKTIQTVYYMARRYLECVTRSVATTKFYNLTA